MHGTYDSPEIPRNVMRTGKGNIDEKRQYERYYNSTVVNEYWPGYSPTSSSAVAYKYFQIWGNDTYQPTEFGTDGGEFKTYVDKDDVFKVFVTPFLKPLDVRYDKT